MRLSAAVASLCVALSLAACAPEAARPTAATVNGRDIPVSQVNEALARFEDTAQFDQLVQQSDPQSARRQFEQAYLAQQVRRAVLRPAAAELGIEVTNAEVEEQLDQIKSQFGSEKEFEQALSDRGFTAQELDDAIRDQLIEQKLREEVTADSTATDREVRQHYEENAEIYEQTRVQHILVEEAAVARAISRRLRAAPERKVDALFAQLARQRSTDRSNRKQAGRLGWVSRGSLVPPFEEAMEDLDVGEISAPVRTDFGVHVIRVTGRRQRPFSEVADEIEATLSGRSAEEAYREWLTNAYEEADVTVNPRYGELDPATGQITNATAEDVPGADEDSSESR